VALYIYRRAGGSGDDLLGGVVGCQGVRAGARLAVAADAGLGRARARGPAHVGRPLVAAGGVRRVPRAALPGRRRRRRFWVLGCR